MKLAQLRRSGRAHPPADALASVDFGTARGTGAARQHKAMLPTARRVARASALTAIAAALTLMAPALSAAAARPARQMRTVLEFDSRLKDETDKPVSGIFRMSFTLLKGGKRRVWSESHWVAVDYGTYALQLGRKSPLPKELDPREMVIQVAIDGAGTILREPLSGEQALTQVEVGGPSGKRIVPYAEKSGFAYEAEHAGVADRIGPYTGPLLAETIDKLDKRRSKVKVSRNRINLTSAGGVGGIPFEQVCPPGTVAVGMRGGSGLYIDNVQVICAPLE